MSPPPPPLAPHTHLHPTPPPGPPPCRYEVSAFSRPSHPAAYLGYPLVRWLQHQYRQQSAREVARGAALAALERSVKGYKHLPSDW